MSHHQSVLRWRWLIVVVALPVALTMWLALAAFWLSLWGAANLAVAVRVQSVPALARAVDGAARSAGVASWIATGWGAAAPIIAPLERAAEAGVQLQEISAAGLELAPALPSALGMDGTRSYLFCGLNDAELFGSGGAPLSGLVVQLDQGEPTIPVSGSVSTDLNPGNEPYPWDVSGGLPWYRPGAEYPFANSNFHPDFRVSGTNMQAAWNALDLAEVDGVITIDVVAVAAVLSATGPVTTQAFGEVSADNVIRTVLVDAYRDYPEFPPESNLARQAGNAELQDLVIERLRDPRTALRAVRALWDVIPGRHVQAHMADPALQATVTALGAEGALSQPSGDVLGVFLQSGPSKLAVFQEQRIERRVQLAADGSAQVRQRVRFTNSVPEGLAGDADKYRSYLALTYRQRVAFRIPDSAMQPTVAVEGDRELVRPDATGPFPDSAGAQVLWQGQDLAPRAQSVTEVSYRLPAGTFTGADGLDYQLTADPQAMVSPPEVELIVEFPDGSAPTGQAEGWAIDGATATWTGTLDRPLAVGVHD